MSIFTRGVKSFTVGRYPQFNNYVSPLSQLYGQTSMTSAAGERIDEWTALGVSAVLGAVSLLADSVASMPLRCFQIDKDGKRIMRSLPDVLANPDPESNTYELIHQIVASLALHGNAYVKIDRDRLGNMIGLVPLHPYQMQVLPTGDQIGRRYLHLGNDIVREDMLHLRWFTPPQSLVGVSPLNQTRNLVGLSIAMDRHLAQFYGEGGTPSSVLETDQKLTLDQARIIQGTWEATHRRHRRPAVLSDGLKWRPITTSAADNQMIATREQLIRDIARIFRIPSHLIGASGDPQTYQNVEQASLNFLTHTIHPWLRRIEIALSTILDKGDDVAFDTSTLLRVDALTRANVNLLNIQMGARTPNEVRLIEGMEPYEGGDKFNQVLKGVIVAGGADVPSLGTDADPSAPVMGVLE
jgi:HK97 family phage portal protein